MRKREAFPWMHACAAGLVSGAALGLFLKAVELRTSYRVYTLLLNVDYIPILNRMQLPELVEFTLHLLISVVISVLLVWLLRSRPWRPIYSTCVVIAVGLFIGLLLYPTTLLSERTPDLTSMPAFLWWLLGHGLYGLLLGLFLRNK